MTSIPSNASRVPNLLAGRIALSNLTRTNARMLTLQSQLATGREILRPSDDAVRATLIGVLDDRLERSVQVRRNLSHAQASLGVLDSALDEANQAALQAKSIGLDQSQLTSSASERAAQAIVVDELIRGLLNVANRQSVAGYAFGGSVTSIAPFVEHLGAVRYVGQGPGLITDLGSSSGVPITLGAGNPLAAIAARVRGSADLDPRLTPDTRLSDLAGARGLGVAPGPVEFSFDSGPRIAIELDGSDTIGDVVARISAALRAYETDNNVTILGPGGVTLGASGISIDVAAGPPDPVLRFFDAGSASAAADLGLAADPPLLFDAGNSTGLDVAPRLTWRTPVASLGAITAPLGRIRINNAGQSAIVDLSGAQTLQDIRTAVEGASLGVRVQINAAGTGIDVLNDLSASSKNSLSIEEVSGGNLTATRLGIRSFSAATRIADFNFGRGVSIIDGVTDPLTGLPDPSLNTDLRITLGDPAGTTIDIDLRPQDMATVQTVLDRLNSQIADALTAAGLPTDSLVAGLSASGNGIRLVQDSAFTSPIRIGMLNNSGAADQLGLLAGSYDASSATFAGTDRAKVRVDSLFSDLYDLAAALRADDPSGIRIATQSIEGSISGLIEARGMVGGFARRVETSDVREQDRATLDEQVRSELRDADFAKAASEFALLQSQLQAGLQSAAAAHRLSILDFLT